MRNILTDDKLVDYRSALSIFLSNISMTKPIKVKISESLGFNIAEGIYSPVDLPLFSRSTVDGYAVRHSHTPGEFRLIGRTPIGSESKYTIKEAETVEVDTGSPIPQGATAVVKVEEVEVKSSVVTVKNKVRLGENIAWVGSDIPRGSKVLSKGERVTPSVMALLGSLGITEVTVYRRPRIGVITTGDELVEPGGEISPGKIYESNSLFIVSRLRKDGYIVDYVIHVPDSIDLLREQMDTILENVDLILLVGGTSAGEKDYVGNLLRNEGKTYVHGINFKPGKPTILGEYKGKPVIGIPGNPVSTAMVTNFLVMPVIYHMEGGRNIPSTAKVQAIAMNEIRGDLRRFTVLPVFLLRGKGGELFTHSVPFDSYMVGTFAMSDGYIPLEPGTVIHEGTKVEVEVFREFSGRSIVGEEDPRVEVGEGDRYLNFGSVMGCNALKYGAGDVVVVSSSVCVPSKYEGVIERDIYEIGQGDQIGYVEWSSLSRYTEDPMVKVRSPSTALQLVSIGRVVIPEGYGVRGKIIGKERLYIVTNRLNN